MKNQRAFDIRHQVRESNPLIHCITNPISIKNCANTILAVGASPIMAEHPLEVEGITQKSAALALNLGNITDARIRSMEISAKTANKIGIPVILDLVGIGVSNLRLELAQKLLNQNTVSVIKGNMSEIKTMLGVASHAAGIDVGQADKIHADNINESLAIVHRLAKKTGSVVTATGKYDLISDGNTSFVLKNGTPMLSTITGTGCMLTALIAAYLPASEPIEAALTACTLMGIAGEIAEQKIRQAPYGALGAASFEVALLDSIHRMEDQTFEEYANWERKES